MIRKENEQAAMLCVDLDRFKAVNDGFGHAAGDQVLVGCAERLRSCIRETDLVARLGGDEFAVLQVGVTRPRDVHALCERILAVMAQPFRLEGTEAVVGASVGVAMIPAMATKRREYYRTPILPSIGRKPTAATGPASLSPGWTSGKSDVASSKLLCVMR